MKRKYATQAEIPEAFRSLFTEQAKEGGGTEWVLTGIEGMVPTEKVKEFRDTNERLLREAKEKDTKLEAFKDVDVEKYHDLLGKEKALAEGKLYDEGKKEELVAKRTEEMRREHKTQLDAIEKRATTAEERVKQLETNLKTQVIDRNVIDAGSKFGLLATAHLDLVERARKVADLDENGKLIFKNPDGSKMYGKDGLTPMSAEEWAEKQATMDAKHLFAPSKGTRANEGGGGGQGSNKDSQDNSAPDVIDGRKCGLNNGEYNPFDRKSRNLDAGARLQEKNPKLAEQLARAVGFPLEPLPEKPMARI